MSVMLHSNSRQQPCTWDLRGVRNAEPELLSGEKGAILGQGRKGGGGSRFLSICSFIHSIFKSFLSSCSGSRSTQGAGTSGLHMFWNQC